KIFHGLIPLKIRKKIAAFYTKNESALILAKLSINKWDDEILDLACGSGTLLTAAYHIKKRLIQEAFTTEHHRKLLDQIYGNDVSIFAAHLATINLAFQNPLAFTNRVNISVGDAFAINPRSLVYSIPSISPKKIDLNGELTETIRYKKFDVIFMNPPFTRHERMELKQKKAIIETVKSQGLSKYLDKKMGYNAYFILHSNIFLKKNGRLALVLPSSTFYADYGQQIKQFFIDKKYSIDYLIELQGVKLTSFSEDCDYKEFLLVASKGSRKKDDFVKIITLFRELEYEECFKISDQIKSITISIKNDIFEIKLLSQEELLNQRNWLNAFKKSKESSFNKILKNTNLLEKIKNNKNIEITSGFHGTYIESLTIPNKYWEIEKDLKDHGIKINLKEDPSIKVIIPRKYLIPSFRKPEFYQKIYEKPNHFVINIREDDTIPVNMGKKYLKFIERKMKTQIEQQIKNGKVRKKLSSFWYCEPNRSGCEKNKSHIWVIWKLRLEKRKSFSFLSSTEATAHHAFYRMKLSDNKMNELIVSWMNTSFWAYQLFINSRTVAKGLIQLMISDIIENYIPKLNLIDPGVIDEIIKTTKALDSIDLPEFPLQFDLKERNDLDKLWLKALKIPDNLIDDILKDLYSYLKEIIIKR
ncbi:MAG: N-6 DNA methylase, partial [Promethearchaeota archaeon]